MRQLWCAIALCVLGPSAAAQTPPADPDDSEGVVGAGPGPGPGPDVVVAPPRIETQDDGRRAIRGAPIERPAPSLQRDALRDFEREAFGPGPGEPKDSDLTGPAEGQRGLRKGELPPALRSPERDASPEELRPDLPWLKGLQTGDLAVRWDRRVIAFLEFYRDDPRGRATMAAWLRAQGRYRDMILEALRRHHLPDDLLYVCMIESSYDPLDVSRVGASGLWQFMPEGGRIYGLRQDYWVDERFDPEKSNEAQMFYFEDLIDRFGNWHLALAAFNAGYGAVLKSLAKYGTNDFWALLELESGLPWESSVYVPKVLATALVGRNLAAFGYDTQVPDPAWSFDRVTVPRGVDLGTVARAAGVDVKAVKALNPALRRGRTPPSGPELQVRIPKGTKERFAQTFPQLRGDWDGYEAYVLRHGERFEDVARTYGISVAKLRDLNGVKDGIELRGGTTLVVPHVDAASRAENARKAEDDLYHSDVVPGGPDEPLLVAVKDKDLVVPGRRRVFYRVVAGDSLDDVAAALGVRPRELVEWNGLDEDTKIQARMVLMAFVPEDFDADKQQVALLDDARILVVTAGSAEHLDIYEGRKGRVRELVTVKDGDTLESIGRRFALTQYDVARINHRSYVTPLEAGEKLVVYKVVDYAKAKKTGVFQGRHEVAARKGKVKKPPAKGKRN
jgi:membrane-bound lytic murein transglycosylase D